MAWGNYRDSRKSNDFSDIELHQIIFSSNKFGWEVLFIIQINMLIFTVLFFVLFFKSKHYTQLSDSLLHSYSYKYKCQRLSCTWAAPLTQPSAVAFRHVHGYWLSGWWASQSSETWGLGNRAGGSRRWTGRQSTCLQMVVLSLQVFDCPLFKINK